MFEVSVHYTNKVALVDEKRKFYCEDMYTAQAIKESLQKKFADSVNSFYDIEKNTLCESSRVSTCGNIRLQINVELVVHQITKMEDVNAIPLVLHNDYECGARDCKVGYYDKWYRYHRADDGASYDKGWQEQNKETQNESVKFIMG